MITILLIRGLSRQQAHWGDFPTSLKQTFNKSNTAVNLVFEDLPGFGTRCQQKSPSSIDKIAELLVPTLEKLHGEANQKVHLLGISMGGMVALELVRRFPEYCESLVMINSSVKPVSRFYERLQPTAYPALIRAWFHPIALESERAILNISSERHKNNKDVLGRWLVLRGQQAPSRIAALKQIFAASQFEAPSIPPLQKVLLIASKKDRIAHYSCTLKLAELWSVECVIEDKAGHDIALDSPQWLANTIADFLVK